MFDRAQATSARPREAGRCCSPNSDSSSSTAPGETASAAVEGQGENLGAGVDADLVVDEDQVELIELALGDLDAPRELVAKLLHFTTKRGSFGFQMSASVQGASEVAMSFVVTAIVNRSLLLAISPHRSVNTS